MRPNEPDPVFMMVGSRSPTRALQTMGIPEEGSLSRCPMCRWWLVPEDHYCADCGTISQHPRAQWRRPVLRFWRRLGAGAGGAIGLATLAIAPIWLGLLVLAPAGVGGGLLFGNGRAEASFARRRLGDRSRDGFQATEAELIHLVAEAEQAIDRISQAEKNVERVTKGADREVTLKMLAQRRGARLGQQDTCSVQLWTIESMRWWNAFLPVLQGIDALTYEEAALRVTAVDNLHGAGTVMLAEWRKARAASSRPGRLFLRRFEEALAHAEQVRAEVAMRQAEAADRGASRVGPHDRPSPVLAREVARFQQLGLEIHAGVFSSARAAVDDEAARLEGESEIEQWLPSDD